MMLSGWRDINNQTGINAYGFESILKDSEAGSIFLFVWELCESGDNKLLTKQPEGQNGNGRVLLVDSMATQPNFNHDKSFE